MSKFRECEKCLSNDLLMKTTAAEGAVKMDWIVRWRSEESNGVGDKMKMKIRKM